MGWRTRLLWGSLILLVWLCLSSVICQLHQHPSVLMHRGSNTGMSPVCSPQLVPCPDCFILGISLSLCNRPECILLLVMCIFPSLFCCLHLLNYCISKGRRALYTLRSVQQLCSCLNNASLFEPGCCVLLCTWLELPLCHRLLDRVSSVVRWPLPLPALLSAGEDSALLAQRTRCLVPC